MIHLQKRALLLLFFLLIGTASFAQGLKVAAAANLQSIIKVLGVDFTKRTGIAVEPIIGSSGNLSSQISNRGAVRLVFICRYELPSKII